MRRRKLFTLAAGASTVLCIAVCVLWVRSYRAEPRPVELNVRRRYVSNPRDPAFSWAGPSNTCLYSERLFLSSRGYLGLGSIEGQEVQTPFGPGLYLSEHGRAPNWLWQEVRPPALGGRRDAPLTRRWGFTAVHGTDASGRSPQGSGVFDPVLSALPPGDSVRYWWVNAPYWFLAVLAAMLPLRWALRRGGTGGNHGCPACGYDLRATPGRCPECGAVPDGKESAVSG